MNKFKHVLIQIIEKKKKKWINRIRHGGIISKTLCKTAIWKSRHLGISIGISIVNLFLSFKALIFAFRSFLWSKTSMAKSFSNTLASFPGSVCYCLEQLFCRVVVAPASEERNSAMDVIKGVLKTRKPESCNL